MSTEKIRIRIKAYDHRILDNAAKKIVETVRDLVEISLVQCHFQQKSKSSQF